MPCYKPNLAFKHRYVKQKLKFVARKHYRNAEGLDPFRSPEYLSLTQKDDWIPLALPCQQCIFCRLQNSKEKAIRAIHQSKSSDHNCFLTLTYNDECVPKTPRGTLIYNYEDIRNFMKRLRYYHSDIKIKSFGCAEYGEKFSRPHFHLCLFNYDFPDKKFWRHSQNDWSDEKWPVYRSKELEELWPFGYAEIGSLTTESASYVARYVTKKITGKDKHLHYEDRPPERLVCNSQGIGLEWLKKYATDVLSTDSVIFKSLEMKIPRYYQKKLEEMYPERYSDIKNQRLDKIREIDLDSTKERLKVREKVHELKAKKLIRSLET